MHHGVVHGGWTELRWSEVQQLVEVDGEPQVVGTEHAADLRDRPPRAVGLRVGVDVDDSADHVDDPVQRGACPGVATGLLAQVEAQR